MSVVHITSLGQFKDKLYFETPKSYYVVDFTAKWCGPCRRIAPLFSSLAEKYQQIGFLKVDVDEVPDISNKYRIKSLPTFLVFKSNNDTPIRTIVGADKTILEQTIDLIASGHYDSPKKDRGQAGKDRNISEEDSSESNEKKDQRKCAKERKSTWE